MDYIGLHWTWGQGGKGRKLAWQGAGHENTANAEDADAVAFAAGGDMPTVSPGGIEPRPNCLWTSQPGGGLSMKFHAIGDSSPPKTLLKQKGLQLAEASFRDCCMSMYITLIHIALQILHNTSSTAQGGGGSFKNRKPTGEVGCCESGMAERSHWLTERWLELCLLEWLQWLQWSPHPQLLDVVWCTATVVVVVVVA